ncbi:MAG TPA: cupredoxin domain-containing protein [Vicinamibacterales bacterium]|nr:cupredoxin domain-containing protein [Vicinamibacterales bacterium]
MRRNVVIILTLLVFAAVGAACGSGYSSNNNGPSFTPVPSGPNTVLAPNGAYLGPGNGFTPATLTVPAGTTVTWGNNDVTTHTVTSDTGVFNSNNLNSGQTFAVKLDAPGTYKYHCTIHSFMNGTIVVQ